MPTTPANGGAIGDHEVPGVLAEVAAATPVLPSGLRVALVHEWLHDRSGSEVLFEALAQTFPDANLYALTRDPDVAFDFGGRSVRTTFLDRPDVRERRSLTLPLMPLAWSRLRAVQDYDVVVTSSHAFAKGFPGARRALHLNYCHTPMRYVWMPELDERVPAWTAPLLAPMKLLDKRGACTVDAFAANSRATAERIERFYGRKATVIYPPVDVGWSARTMTARSSSPMAWWGRSRSCSRCPATSPTSASTWPSRRRWPPGSASWSVATVRTEGCSRSASGPSPG